MNVKQSRLYFAILVSFSIRLIRGSTIALWFVKRPHFSTATTPVSFRSNSPCVENIGHGIFKPFTAFQESIDNLNDVIQTYTSVIGDLEIKVSVEISRKGRICNKVSQLSLMK